MNVVTMSRVAGVWWRGSDLEVVSGQGTTVTAADGTEYLDFTSGIGVTNTGHCHPRVVEAIRRQAGQFIHAQVNVYRHPLLEELAEALDGVTPPHLDRFFFTNSGAEAIEAGVKLARQATGRPNLVVFQGAFHGRTAQTMAMTSSKVVYRAGHTPLPAGVFVAPYPYPFRTGEEPDAAAERCLASVRHLLRTQTAPEETAAVVIETVLGEGGYLVPPRSFLRGLGEICREHGILLVLDEIQCGVGRTGRHFAFEHFGIEPDILVMAKGLGSGFPIAGIAARAEHVDRWPPGSHGGTYGGNPIGCAAALATLQTIREERLLENANERGAQLMEALRALQERHSTMGDVRGLGLMVACELVTDDRSPAGERTKDVLRHCLTESRVVLLDCGTDGNVIRFVPPLVVSAEQIDQAVAAVDAALHATA
jgi:4-aminobutyrate aminotransferase